MFDFIGCRRPRKNTVRKKMMSGVIVGRLESVRMMMMMMIMIGPVGRFEV